MFKYITPIVLAILAISCRNDAYIADSLYDNDVEEYNEDQVDLYSFPDWTELTHGNSTDPNFDEVFNQYEVMTLVISISSSDWSAMWSDLSTNLGSNNKFGADATVDFTPIWVPCTVNYNDTDWYQVGVRFKGNSSLSQTYSSNNDKLSLKLDFDQYEDDYPALTNQRFYGFKQLNLNNNYNDVSLMREKVTTDLFRSFGLAAANTRFCAVYLSYGYGEQYYGLYTMVEEVDDTVIKSQFSDGSGNAYKPEEDAGSFEYGTYDEDEFGLKTNTLTATYSDIRSLYTTLHSSTRTSNEEEWVSQMESVFNVDVFMKWLAANTAVQNWDSYGNMAHNYYLYNNPTNNLLTWIPWDHNESLQDATGSYVTYTPSQLFSSRYIDDSWPLIYFLLSVDEYKDLYYDYLRQFIEDVFEPTKMEAIYESHHTLIKQYAYDEIKGRTFINSDAQFDGEVEDLKEHAEERYELMDSYLTELGK